MKIYLLLFLLLSIYGFGQKDIKNQILSNFKEIKTLQSNDDNYSDLEVIGESIGDSKIVFLGEQDHGDGTTFEAKTRLIKYLHEKKDFDILVFESDFWGLTTTWDKFQSDGFNINQIKENTYKIWSECEQVQELFNYIEKAYSSDDQLIVSGMDCNHFLVNSKRNYKLELTKFIQDQPVYLNDTIESNSFIRVANNLIQEVYSNSKNINETPEIDKSLFYRYIDKLILTITDSFWKQELINLKGTALFIWSNGNLTIRDEYMAKNLLWLYNEKFKGRKIIVWAHNLHVAKNFHSVIPNYKTSVGNQIYNQLKEKIYILGFTSLQGSFKRTNYDEIIEINKPNKKSFESYVSNLNYNFGFLDLKTLNQKLPFKMSGIFHNSSIKANWSTIFDGVFYIKEMKGCDKN